MIGRLATLEKKIAEYEHAIEDIRSSTLSGAIIQTKLEEFRRTLPMRSEPDSPEDNDSVSDTLQRLSGDQDTLVTDIEGIRAHIGDLQEFLTEFKSRLMANDVELAEERSQLHLVSPHCPEWTPIHNA